MFLPEGYTSTIVDQVTERWTVCITSNISHKIVTSIVHGTTFVVVTTRNVYVARYHSVTYK